MYLLTLKIFLPKRHYWKALSIFYIKGGIFRLHRENCLVLTNKMEVFPVRGFRHLNINPGPKAELNMIKSRSMSWQSVYPVNMMFRFIWETTWKKIWLSAYRFAMKRLSEMSFKLYPRLFRSVMSGGAGIFIFENNSAIVNILLNLIL